MSKLIKYIIIIVICIFVFQFVRGFFMNKVETELVRGGALEDAISTWGYLVKDEDVHISSVSGYAQLVEGEGKRIRVGQKIMTIYKNAVDTALKDELDVISAKISEIQASTIQKVLFENDIVKLEKMTSGKLTDITRLVYDRKLTDIPTIKGDINVLIGRKLKVSGKEGPQVETLDSLNKRKRDIEQRLGSSKVDIYSGAGGVLSRAIDGLEGVLAPNVIDKLTPSKIDEIDNVKPIPIANDVTSGQAVCKTINNIEYYVAATLEAKKVMPINKGERVKVRFTDFNPEAVDGEVVCVSEEEGGRVVVTIKVTRYIEGIYSVRKTGVDIIKRTYSGFKLPVSAIKVIGGQKGAYVVKEGIMRFKPIEILYNSSDYVIIKEEIGNPKAVLLYDEVVTKSNKYEDGIVVG